jgi:hypothetical protein
VIGKTASIEPIKTAACKIKAAFAKMLFLFISKNPFKPLQDGRTADAVRPQGDLSIKDRKIC